MGESSLLPISTVTTKSMNNYIVYWYNSRVKNCPESYIRYIELIVIGLIYTVTAARVIHKGILILFF